MQERSDERGGEYSRYEFIHDLYRNAAFDRSSQGRRRHWYKRIAEKMAADLGDRADDAATELAYYFEHAGMPSMAAQYCAAAGEKASKQFAYAEALAQFRRGIELVKKTGGSNERDQIELRLQTDVALPLIVQQGYQSEEVVAALARARELNEKLGDAPQNFAVLRGLYELLAGQADYESSLALCDKIDLLAQREKDPYIAGEALGLRGVCDFYLGHLRESRNALAGSIAAYEQQSSPSERLALNGYSAVSALSVLSLVLWMLGFPDQAVQSARDALDHATALDRGAKFGAPFSIVIARCFRAMLMRFLRDHAATIAEANAAMATADNYGFVHWRAQAALEHGWAVAMQGRGNAGFKEIRSTVNSVSLGISGSMAKLADVCLTLGKTAEGLRAAEQALEFVTEHKEGAWEPELYRLKGELLVRRAQGGRSKRSADFEKAERCFTTAIDRAQVYGAKSFELRAAMSLHRLWSEKGKRAEARQIVAEVYHRFSEGFDTRDLIEARRMLRKQ
jgi:adenylate cyclase